jgi:hypothetical protein
VAEIPAERRACLAMLEAPTQTTCSSRERSSLRIAPLLAR